MAASLRNALKIGGEALKVGVMGTLGGVIATNGLHSAKEAYSRAGQKTTTDLSKFRRIYLEPTTRLEATPSGTHTIEASFFERALGGTFVSQKNPYHAPWHSQPQYGGFKTALVDPAMLNGNSLKIGAELHNVELA